MHYTNEKYALLKLLYSYVAQGIDVALHSLWPNVAGILGGMFPESFHGRLSYLLFSIVLTISNPKSRVDFFWTSGLG